MYGNTNAPPAVTFSAIIYSLRCMVHQDIPLNQGCMAPITVKIPPGSILSPSAEAAVVGGNVLTSQRVTDVVLKAFNAAAASQVRGTSTPLLASIQTLVGKLSAACESCPWCWFSPSRSKA